jgi:uncharacterized protein YbjT (DUF2867 family)
MQANAKIAVAGATGRVGHHVVDLLQESGYEVVPMSRSTGVDVVAGDGLAKALLGVECVIDTATGPSSEEAAAKDFFTTAARNLQEAGERAGVRRIVAVSIIGCDRFRSGYNAAKVAHEQATTSGPVAGRVLRAAQFHEFIEQLVDRGRLSDVSYVPEMTTQLVAARTVAAALVEIATDPSFEHGTSIPEIAGPRQESLLEMARLFVLHRGEKLRIEALSNASDPDRELYVNGGLLPSAHATLAGPSFEQWLDEGDAIAKRAA